jgi:predicted aldo/keto reductase-like oxidoreductase
VKQPRLTFAVPLKDNGSSGSLRLGSNPSSAASWNLLFFRTNAEVTKFLAGARCGVDLEECLELLSDPSLLLDRADLLAEVAFEGL